jgi:hypothetical protein
MARQSGLSAAKANATTRVVVTFNTHAAIYGTSASPFHRIGAPTAFLLLFLISFDNAAAADAESGQVALRAHTDINGGRPCHNPRQL